MVDPASAAATASKPAAPSWLQTVIKDAQNIEGFVDAVIEIADPALAPEIEAVLNGIFALVGKIANPAPAAPTP